MKVEDYLEDNLQTIEVKSRIQNNAHETSINYDDKTWDRKSARSLLSQRDGKSTAKTKELSDYDSRLSISEYNVNIMGDNQDQENDLNEGEGEGDQRNDNQELKIDPRELLIKSEVKKVVMRADRRDYYGMNIIKGNKLHRVTFIDKVKKGKKLADIIYIENFKKLIKKGKFDDDECKCLIF